jgi:uncharacterized repeat protein (TIGR01451 family)
LNGGGASTSRAFALRLVNPLPAGITAIRNTACSGSACSTIAVPTDGSPQLAISKTAVSGSTTPGNVLVYEIAIQNTGNQAASNVSIRETVPQHTTFHALSSEPDWSCSGIAAGSACTLPVGDVPAGGAVLTRRFAVRIDNPLPAGTTTIGNTVCAVLPSSPDVCSTLPIPSQGTPRLALAKVLSGGSPSPGATVVYTLSVANNGDQAAGPVPLSEVVPLGTTFNPATSSPGWTCAPSNASGPRAR